MFMCEKKKKSLNISFFIYKKKSNFSIKLLQYKTLPIQPIALIKPIDYLKNENFECLGEEKFLGYSF